MQRFPLTSPFSVIFLPSLSTRIGLIPKKGSVAEPGFVAIAPGKGEIKIDPVSVCQYVSTIGHLPLPIFLLYHSYASGLIGSPTVTKSRSDFKECFSI